MIPAADLAIFAVCGLSLAAWRRVAPGSCAGLVTRPAGLLGLLGLLLPSRACTGSSSWSWPAGSPSRRRPADESPSGPVPAGWSARACRCWRWPWCSPGRPSTRHGPGPREPWPAARGPGRDPNVLFIVLDTVRADEPEPLRLRAATTTPNLARAGPRRASGSTAPVHRLLDAPLAREHVHRPVAARALGRLIDGRSTRRIRPWPSSSPARATRRPGSSPTRYYCNAGYGLDRGFAHYEDFRRESRSSPLFEIVRSTSLGKWLAAG